MLKKNKILRKTNAELTSPKHLTASYPWFYLFPVIFLDSGMWGGKHSEGSGKGRDQDVLIWLYRNWETAKKKKKLAVNPKLCLSSRIKSQNAALFLHSESGIHCPIPLIHLVPLFGFICLT